MNGVGNFRFLQLGKIGFPLTPCTMCTPWTLGDWSPLRQLPPGARSGATRACGAGTQ